ncbi:MAG: hypothetical protein EA411_06890 [Saprospirales bacterium]|nr:MAG: hypothetical protein EA411_06890 [Saprospirales bacterium]
MILEGFLSELLKVDIKIKNLLESESNKSDKDDRHNKCDLLCENDRGELKIIEVQFHREMDYFQRMLYATSKVITEYIAAGEEYAEVKRVYSVNILYFDLGQGADYLYKGTTEFRGMKDKDRLRLSRSQIKTFGKEYPSDLYPEYYLIKVNNFDDVAKNSLEEWIYYLKKSELPPITITARGLDKVNERFKYDKMDATQKKEYDRYLESLQASDSAIETARYEAIEEGREEAISEKNMQFIVNSYKEGLKIPTIAKIVAVSEGEVKRILQDKGLH